MKIKKEHSVAHSFEWGTRTMNKQEAYQQINKLSVVVGNWYKHENVAMGGAFFFIFYSRYKIARRINSLILCVSVCCQEEK